MDILKDPAVVILIAIFGGMGLVLFAYLMARIGAMGYFNSKKQYIKELLKKEEKLDEK